MRAPWFVPPPTCFFHSETLFLSGQKSDLLLLLCWGFIRIDYKPQLQEYYDRALFECLKKGMAHQPHMLRNALKMHTNFMEKGTMKVEKWD